MSNVQTSELAPIYSKAKSYLYKRVTVVTNVKQHIHDDNSQLTYTGYLKAIDPVTVSLILCRVDSDTQLISDNTLILGHVIKEILPSTDSNNIEATTICHIIDKQRLTSLEKHPHYHRAQLSQDLQSAQKRIVEWFNKYRIPIELNSNQELVVANSVRIKAPYNHETDYICPTGIILKRIKYMVDRILTDEKM